MKRNWDTIREILIKLEEMPPEKGGLALSDFPSERNNEISYHVELLIEAGLVHGTMSKVLGSHAHHFMAIRMTWGGHELLDAIRNDTVWEKTKTSFIKKGLSMTLDLVKSVATDIAMSFIKSTIGS